MKLRRGPLTNLIDVAEERRRKLRFKRYNDDPLFKKQVEDIRNAIASGKNLFEIKQNLGLEGRRWNDMIWYLSANYYKTENLVFEWQLRQQSRYQLAVESYNYAKRAGDYDAMMRAVAIMNKLDETDIDMKSKLGIIKPVQVDDKGGEGISHNDLLMTEQKFNELLEQRIITKLSLEREAEQPITLDVLSRPQLERKPDTVEQTPLAQDTAFGSVTAHPVSEGLTDGRVDVLNPLDVVGSKDG